MRPWRWVMCKANFPPSAPGWNCWCGARRCRRWWRRCRSCRTATSDEGRRILRRAQGEQQFSWKEMTMSETRYTDQHEWVRLEGSEATVGITKFAAEALGDVVFVELPNAGRKVGAGAEAAVVESVKAASEVY